jgi:hypothetical protein
MYAEERKYFEALADELSQSDTWAQYPELVMFARHMAAGDRNLAVHGSVRPLIARLVGKSLRDRVAFVDAVLSSTAEGGPRRRLPSELIHRLLAPAVAEQLAQHPEDAKAHLWSVVLDLADYPGRSLDRALELDPGSQLICLTAARLSLSWLEYALHEVPSGLLESPESILRHIARVREVCPRLPAELAERYAEHADSHHGKYLAYAATKLGGA